MKGTIEDPTWGWMWRVLIIAAVLWLMLGFCVGCQKVKDKLEVEPARERLAELEAEGIQVLDQGDLVYVLDRKREMCFVSVPPYRMLTPLSGRDCYRLLVNSAREALEE